MEVASRKPSTNDYFIEDIEDENLVNLLVDKIGRKIIFCIQQRPKSIKEITNESNFSRNTVYRRIQEFKKMNLLKVSGELDENRKRQYFFQSKIYSYDLKYVDGKTRLKLIYNDL